MKPVLVTGAAGKVGRAVATRLEELGRQVRRFDLALGHDLRSEHDVASAMVDVGAVVHAGALAHDWAGTAADIMATNVLGTWHVLLAAEAERVGRVVHFSSAQVFGFADGESDPAYVPVDDDHPLRAAHPYGLSKRLAEDMCEAWSKRTGIDTIVLRPVLILGDGDPRLLDECGAQLGAYVHVDDVVDATLLALDVGVPRHSRMTLCGPGDFETRRAKSVLGWTPQRGWP